MAKQENHKAPVDHMATRIARYERRQKRSMYFALGAALILLLVGVLWMVYSYTKVQTLNEQYSALQEEIKAAKTEQAKARELNLANNPRGDEQSVMPAEEKIAPEKADQPDTKESEGEKTPQKNPQRVVAEQKTTRPARAIKAKAAEAEPAKSPEANRQRAKAEEELKKLLQTNHINKNITIEYYQKAKDKDKVRVSIKQLGYTRFDEKQSGGALRDAETNCIYYGSRVSLIDVKAVALSLIKAGFRIRKISPFKHLTDKKDVVQIIGVKYPEDSPESRHVYTVEEIQKTFPLANASPVLTKAAAAVTGPWVPLVQ